jgi:hypothetical protein
MMATPPIMNKIIDIPRSPALKPVHRVAGKKSNNPFRNNKFCRLPDRPATAKPTIAAKLFILD